MTDPVPLQAVLDAAPEGSEVRVAAGVHEGNFVVPRPLRLTGKPGAILDGGGRGNVLEIAAPDVTVRGLRLRNGGADLGKLESALFVRRDATRAAVEDNRIEARGFGIWVDGTDDVRIAGNRISGDTALRSQDRGDGIRLYAATGAEVIGNEIWEARDGIYIEVSHHNRLVGNRLRHQRYGIHYMYSQSNEVRDNFSHDNRLGYALMQSRYLTVVGNRSENDQNYAFLLNFIVDSVIAENISVDTLRGTTPGGAGAHRIAGAEGKALFIYNSPFNEIRDNVFARAEIGVHLTAGSEGNVFHGNAFINNRTQVMYVATREQEWSHEGRGNYWSNYLGWDLTGDGIGDTPFEPNDAVDRLLWQYPMAKVLMNSPSVLVLRWAQRMFPVLRPPGVRDSYPLMRPPQPGAFNGPAD